MLAVGCAADAGSDDEDETGGESGDETGGDELPPIDPAICDGMEFDNVVDEASCDEIYGRGIEPEMADDVEMCRRLFVDLTGSLPTRAEYNSDCKERGTTKIVDDLMGRDTYVELGQRMWADILLTTSNETLYTYLIELDDLVGDLYRGDMKLPRFAELVSTHPGFTGRFDGQDLVGFSFQAFLGRDAAPHERVGLEPLWHMWQERFEDQHPDYYFGYSRVVINSILCMGSNEGLCHSDLWGHHSVILPVVEEDNYDYDGVNVYPVEDLSGDEWNTVRLPGRLIAEQPTFYEAAVDRALMRYLGYEAGAQLPLVRQRLVDMMHDSGGDVRELEREILTSELYRMAAAYPEDETPLEDADPDFWHGPMKQLSAEAWLDSVEKLTQVELGNCDHRFNDVQGGRPLPDSPYEDTWWHPSRFPIDDNGFPPERNKPDYTYRNMARQLGGCPDQQGQLRYTGTGVMISIGYSSFGAQACESAIEGSPMLPNGFTDLSKSEEDLRGAANDLYRQALLRAPSEDLDETLSAAVSGCRDASECDARGFIQHTCTALLQSAPFVFY